MPLALDTVLLDVHNAATSALGLTAATPANADSLSVRAFDTPGVCRLHGAFLQGSGTRQMRIASPRLHDNVTGLTFQSGESPAEFLFPPDLGQPMYSVDQLQVQLDAAASSDTVAALLLYYSALDGIDAQLKTWADIRPQIVNLKTVEVSVVSSATIGQWSDTSLTATENQLKADAKYAVLGFETSAALLCMGLKGPSTGNLRACVPGAASTFPLTDYFIEMGNRHNLPYIPVFKANDRANTFVSVAANTASVNANVYMVCAQLSG